MTLLAIVSSFLLFANYSLSAPDTRFLVPESYDPTEQALRKYSDIDPRASKIFSEEDLVKRGLEYRPNVKEDYKDFLQSRAEMNRNPFSFNASKSAIRAYRAELKRNDEMLKTEASPGITE